MLDPYYLTSQVLAQGKVIAASSNCFKTLHFRPNIYIQLNVSCLNVCSSGTYITTVINYQLKKKLVKLSGGYNYVSFGVRYNNVEARMQ